MQEASNQAGTIIIAVVLILVILGVFMLVILSYYNNRKLNSIREKEMMKNEFDQTLTKVQLEVQEQTMKYISQEIHDNIGQILTLVNLNLKTLKDGETEKVNATSSLVNKAIDDLRSLSKSLNPEYLVKTGIVQIIKNEFDQLERTGRFSTRINAETMIVLPGDKVLILYRMIQEVLNNIVKHSGATEVVADISANLIVIKDNGCGFDVTSNNSNGLGLSNFKSRAKLINAEVNISSEKGKGTIVIFKLN